MDKSKASKGKAKAKASKGEASKGKGSKGGAGKEEASMPAPKVTPKRERSPDVKHQVAASKANKKKQMLENQAAKAYAAKSAPLKASPVPTVANKPKAQQSPLAVLVASSTKAKTTAKTKAKQFRTKAPGTSTITDKYKFSETDPAPKATDAPAQEAPKRGEILLHVVQTEEVVEKSVNIFENKLLPRESVPRQLN